MIKLSFCRVSFLVFACVVFSAQAHAFYPKNYVGDIVEYDARYEDTFVYLARDYNLGYVEMRAANPGVDPWVPGEGTDIVLPTRHLLPDTPREGIVINIPEMRLYAYVNENKAPTTFPIGIGREGLATPLGQTKIVRKVDGPTWRPTERMRREDPKLPEAVGPGPENPLGSHALYLGWPQYLIHGTNRPFGIGRRISSGCIRLYPEDIKILFKLIPVGTPVRVVDQPIKLAWIDDELFIEVHPEIEQAIEMEETGRISAPQLSEEDMDRIIAAAGEFRDRLRWSTIRMAVRERRGYPISIARRPGYVVPQSRSLAYPVSAQDIVNAGKEEKAAAVQEELKEIEDAKSKGIEVLEDIYEGESLSEESRAEEGESSEEAGLSRDFHERFDYRALNP